VARKHAEHQIVIKGAPQACFDALTDYESFPDWQSAVKHCEVLTRAADGRGEEVEFEVDAKVRTIHYTLRYSYEPPHRIGWDYVDGDVRDVDGEYIFEDRGDGTTLATYSLALDPGVWLPDKLARALSEQVMKGQMEELKARVEGG
jgi:ribosome-associated toxin RatA of RatAB toxin-antitoxin module